MISFAVMAGLVLSACAESPAWHMTTTQEQKIEYFRSQCAAFGHRDGTPEMASCIERASRSSAAQARSNVGAAFAEAGQNYSNAAAEARARAPVSCTTVHSGFRNVGTSRTTCY
jgi:hypothetical protein